MSDYIRPQIPGATIFFTVNVAERGSHLLTDNIQLLRDAYHRVCLERPFQTDAIVILPDHIHAVWTLPSGDSDYSTRWRLIKARFSRRLPKGQLRPSHVARGERGLWQRRFWERHVRCELERDMAIACCHLDPVRHGLAAGPSDWAHSSVHRDGAVRAKHAPYAGRTIRNEALHGQSPRIPPIPALSPDAPLR